MKELADYLTNLPERRPVIDRTGLKGLYLIDLKFALTPANRGVDIWTAVKEELGLGLENIKATFDTIVIDHIERPSEN